MTTTTTIQAQIDELGPWFHNLHLPTGEQTAPRHALGDFPGFKWQEVQDVIPHDLSGWRVLDVGCNAGYYSLQLASRGADVLGIDVDPHYLRQAAWAAEQFGLNSKIELRHMQVYDVARLEEEFDLIWYMGVFYHLRYPLLSLDILAQKTKRLLLFQTLTMPGEQVKDVVEDLDFNDRAPLQEAGWPKMAFIEKRMAGDLTNWWIANHAGIEAMLRSCGLAVVERPGHEIYLCAPDVTLRQNNAWNHSEYLAATGANWQEEVAAKVSGKNDWMNTRNQGQKS